jgi:hypothetical protein
MEIFVIIGFVALVFVGTVFLRGKIGAAQHGGQNPDEMPGRFMQYVELALVIFFCLLIRGVPSRFGQDSRNGIETEG